MDQIEQNTEIQGIDIVGPLDAQSIVFVHGAMFTRKMWAPQRDALSEEFQVIALDLPGHGVRSDRPFQLETALDLLDEVIETLANGHAILVGLSLGGYVSTEYASQHPEKVDGLVVAGSSVNPVGWMKGVTRIVGGASRLATKSTRVEQNIRRAGEKWIRKRGLPVEIEAEIIDAGIYPQQFGEAGLNIQGTDFRAGLATYPGPTLVLNGTRDLIMRSGEKNHATAANDAYLASIDGVGHICNLSRPEAFTDIMRRFNNEIVNPPNDS